MSAEILRVTLLAPDIVEAILNGHAPSASGLPRLLEAAAFTEQWWDRSEGRFRIRTKVLQRQLGTVLEYRGSFSYQLVPSQG